MPADAWAGENFHRRNSRRAGLGVVRVLPGGYYVTSRSDEVLTTTLGSCVAACIRDPLIGIGGMNHFMLASARDPDGRWGTASAAMRYGSFAMEHLINAILKAGGNRRRLEVKLFGGGNLMGNSTMIGSDNADFAETYCAAEGFAVASHDLRGNLPRHVEYFPRTGRVLRKILRPDAAEARTVLAEEERHRRLMVEVAVEGEIELFE